MAYYRNEMEDMKGNAKSDNPRTHKPQGRRRIR